MTDYDSNPFADPEAVNPFQDPSVQQATVNSSRGLEEINPFEDRNTQTSKSTPTQPAVMKPTMDPAPPAYTPSAAQPVHTTGQEDILKRQEELERKAAELQRREQQLQATQYNIRVNNWPPLPSCCPLQPCFYQDFAVDIPLEFQRTVRMGYYIWIAYVNLLLLNVIVSMAYMIIGGSDEAPVTFGLSILFLLLWTPCSLICWYRPMYRAFRSDSSFNFFMFFLVFGAQFLCTIVQALGVNYWGSSGIWNGIWLLTTHGDYTPNNSQKTVGAMLCIMGVIWIILNIAILVFIVKVMGKPGGGQKAVAAMMLCEGCLFLLLAVMMVVYLTKVHSLYRTTGASFQKAQQEFAKGVVTNPTVQTAAQDAGRAAASGAAEAAVSGAVHSVSSPNNRM